MHYQTVDLKDAGMTMDSVQMLGLAGMILVFASFIVKDWKWLYTFNMSGATLLAAYAYLQGDMIFTTVEAGIVAFLMYRLVQELRARSPSKGGGSRLGFAHHR